MTVAGTLASRIRSSRGLTSALASGSAQGGGGLIAGQQRPNKVTAADSDAAEYTPARPSQLGVVRAAEFQR